MSESAEPFFSIVIVCLNGQDALPKALQAVRQTRYPHYEVIVVDNGSTDRTAEIVRNLFPEVRLIRSPVNLGFAGGNNLGLRAAHGDILVLLNDDTEVRPDWLEAWARAAAQYPRWGILGAKLLYPDGQTIQHAGGTVDPNGLSHHFGYGQPDDGRFDEVVSCDYCTGAALAIRRELYETIGPLDPEYYPIYFEETDYCRMARRAGYEVLYIPEATIVHHESRTQSAFSFRFNFRYTCGRVRFVLKNFTARELARAARRELGWWRRRHAWPYARGVVCAYLVTLTRLPGILRARRRTQSLGRRLRPSA